MYGPLDLERLAGRIERLEHTRRHDWHPAGDLEFGNALPSSRVPDRRRVLPAPTKLRELAQSYPLSDEDSKGVTANYRTWLSLAQRLEGIKRDNDPRNPKRMMRDLARGRFPR